MTTTHATYGQLHSRVFSKKRQFLGPIFTEGSLTLLHAKRGAGKSFLALKIAHSIATRSQFLKWRGEAAGRVVYFEGEMGQEVVYNRLTKIDEAAPFQLRGDDFKFVTYEHCGGVLWNLSDPIEQQLYFKEAIGYEVIVIDNYLTATSPMDKFDDEVRQWKRIQPFLLKLRDMGKCVILVHHAGKSGEQYGSILKENLVDSSIALKPVIESEIRSGLHFDLVFEKNRHFHGEDAEALRVSYVADRWTYETAASGRTTEILKMRNQGMTQRQIADAMNLPLYDVVRAINEPNPYLSAGAGDESF